MFLESFVHSAFTLYESHFYWVPYMTPSQLLLEIGMRNSIQERERTHTGFSVVELLVVLGIIALLSAISLPYIVNYKKVYKSEDQALKVIDLMREANQLAITRRRTMRFEIDLTDNTVAIIDENGTGADTEVKEIPLELTRDVRIDSLPTGVTKPNPPNYTDITFTTDAIGHMEGATSVIGHQVWAARFRSDGSMVNAANTPISVNIYSWPPITPGSTSPRSKLEVRAITVFGGSGAIRYWKHNGINFVASQ